MNANVAANAACSDDPPHRPRRAIGKQPDQGGADDASAVLQGADQGRYGARALGQEVERTRDRVGDDEPVRRHEHEQRDRESRQPAPYSNRKSPHDGSLGQ